MVQDWSAVSWQAVFPRADVEIVRDSESPLLARLSERLREPHARGLMLRLCTYRTVYFQNGVLNQLEPAADLDELAQLHAQGKPVSNPAYSLVVATLGVWFEGESEPVPAGVSFSRKVRHLCVTRWADQRRLDRPPQNYMRTRRCSRSTCPTPCRSLTGM